MKIEELYLSGEKTIEIIAIQNTGGLVSFGLNKEGSNPVKFYEANVLGLTQ